VQRIAGLGYVVPVHALRLTDLATINPGSIRRLTDDKPNPSTLALLASQGKEENAAPTNPEISNRVTTAAFCSVIIHRQSYTFIVSGGTICSYDGSV
jgi:hypothetical protein